MKTELRPTVDGFDRPKLVGDGGLKLPVYTSIDGLTPIIVLHELPGMTPEFVAYCRRMVAYGFKVHAPLMFGQPEKTKSPLGIAKFCMSHEFKSLFRQETDSTTPTQFTSRRSLDSAIRL